VSTAKGRKLAKKFGMQNLRIRIHMSSAGLTIVANVAIATLLGVPRSFVLNFTENKLNFSFLSGNLLLRESPFNTVNFLKSFDFKMFFA